MWQIKRVDKSISIEFGHLSLDETRNLPLSLKISPCIIDGMQRCVDIKVYFQTQSKGGDMNNSTSACAIGVHRTSPDDKKVCVELHEIDEEILRVYAAELTARFACGGVLPELKHRFDELAGKNSGCPACLDIKVAMDEAMLAMRKDKRDTHSACCLANTLSTQKASV